jgi:hypothetical protein
MMFAHQRGEPRAVLRRIAARDQLRDRRRHPLADPLRRQAEIGGAHHLALAHRNAAEHLREVFAEPDAYQQRLGFTEASCSRHPLGVTAELADRLHIGREPGEPVGRALLLVDQLCGNPPVLGDLRADRADRVGQQGFDRGRRLMRAGNEVGAGRRTGCGKRHRGLRGRTG